MDGEHWPLAHRNLTVSDLDRSIAFHRRWFGSSEPPTTCPDSTVFLRTRDDFDLALRPGVLAARPPRTVHFGFRRLEAALRAAAVPVTEHHDAPDDVSLTCLDLDGYELEVYREPPRPATTAVAT